MNNIADMVSTFERLGDQCFQFANVENPTSACKLVHAMNMLSLLDPTTTRGIDSVGHDEIWFGFDPSVVARNITHDQIIDLIRCGVRWDDEYECFASFV